MRLVSGMQFTNVVYVLFFQELSRFSITQGGDPDVFKCTARLIVQVADQIPHFLAFGEVFITIDDLEAGPEFSPLIDVAVESADGKYRELDGSSWI